MIHAASQLIERPVYSLQQTSHVGEISGLLIDPHRLSLAAFWVKDKKRRRNFLVVIDDIFGLDINHLVINHPQDLTLPGDLPRLAEVLEIDYQIPGKKIIANKKVLGIASDFGIGDDNYQVRYIAGQARFWHKLRGGNLRFMRQQIKKINDRSIEVKSGPSAEKIKAWSGQPAA